MQIDWDMFFYYGTEELNQEDEDEFDVMQGLMQPKKSLMYFRQEGAGVQDNENMPGALANYILLRADIVKWFAFRNGYVSDGRNNFPDRRLLTSQNIIGMQELIKGELNLIVFYITFRDYKNIKNAVQNIS